MINVFPQKEVLWEVPSDSLNGIADKRGLVINFNFEQPTRCALSHAVRLNSRVLNSVYNAKKKKIKP